MDNQTNKIVARVFTELIAIFPAWHTAAKFTDPEAWSLTYKRILKERLIERNVTDIEQIRAGLAASKKLAAQGNPYMPSAMQFVEFCKPSAPSHTDFKQPKLIAPTEGAKEKSKQIASWYKDRIREIQSGETVNYDAAQDWEGGITASYKPGDEHLRHQCLRAGMPYFKPTGGVEYGNN